MESAQTPSPHQPSGRLTTLLLALSTVLLCLCLVLAAGWYLAQKAGTIRIEDLSQDQAQALVEQYLERAPSVLRRAFFEPRIGYTLRPSSELSAWGDTFRSNELGYRTGSVKKAAGAYRVLFVGDSWTYGLGVSEKESFPQQLAELANAFAGLEREVTSWTLALPGYNTVNELAALDAFYDQIQPDAVVICPTGNDINGTLGVDSDGKLVTQRRGEWKELYLRGLHVADSHLDRTLWRDRFSALAQTAQRLTDKDVPFFAFFVMGGYEPFVHLNMQTAAVKAPYAIVPVEYLRGQWINKGSFGHGTPEAYRVFARIVYRMIAEEVGWQALPEQERSEPGAEVEIYSSPPPGDWEGPTRQVMRKVVIPPYDFEPAAKYSHFQIKSGVDNATGAVSSNPAVILIKRREGSTSLRLHLRRLPDARLLYPLNVDITIPSPSGGSRSEAHLTEDGPDVQTAEIEIPGDIDADSWIDLIIETPRCVLDESFIARSFYVVRVEQR